MTDMVNPSPDQKPKISKQLRRMRKYRAEKRVGLAAIKTQSGCLICGETDHRCLQFHHRDRLTKVRSISRFYAGTWGWTKILAEIEKCDILCANCHLKTHRDIDDEQRIAA